MKWFGAVSCCQELMAMAWQECGEQAQEGCSASEMFISPVTTENKAVLLSHARVNLGLSPGLLLLLMQSFLVCFSCASAHVFPSQGWEKQTPLRGGCPGEPQLRISLQPLPAWLPMPSSSSACSLPAQGFAEPR